MTDEKETGRGVRVSAKNMERLRELRRTEGIMPGWIVNQALDAWFARRDAQVLEEVKK